MPSTHSGTETDVNGRVEGGGSNEFDVVVVDGSTLGDHGGGAGLGARQGDGD